MCSRWTETLKIFFRNGPWTVWNLKPKLKWFFRPKKFLLNCHPGCFRGSRRRSSRGRLRRWRQCWARRRRRPRLATGRGPGRPQRYCSFPSRCLSELSLWLSVSMSVCWLEWHPIRSWELKNRFLEPFFKGVVSWQLLFGGINSLLNHPKGAGFLM